MAAAKWVDEERETRKMAEMVLRDSEDRSQHPLWRHVGYLFSSPRPGSPAGIGGVAGAGGEMPSMIPVGQSERGEQESGGGALRKESQSVPDC